MLEEESKVLQKLALGRYRALELGTFTGGTASVILSALAPEGHLYTIDTFQGWSGGSGVNQVPREEQLRLLLQTLKAYEGRFTILIGDYSRQVSLFADGIFDFIFIDGAHDYRSVRRDILQWLPKLSPEGLMCGHDLDASALNLDHSILIKHKDEDYTPSLGIHCGVALAVTELFPKVSSSHRLWWNGPPTLAK